MSKRDVGGVERSASKAHVRAQVLTWVARDDVDHARQRVRAPQGRAGTAHDFNLLDFIEVHTEQIPDDHSVIGLIRRAAVYQRERLVRRLAGRASRGELHIARGELNHVHTGNAPQHVGIVGDGFRLDVVGALYRYGRRGEAHHLFLAAARDDNRLAVGQHDQFQYYFSDGTWDDLHRIALSRREAGEGRAHTIGTRCQPRECETALVSSGGRSRTARR